MCRTTILSQHVMAPMYITTGRDIGRKIQYMVASSLCVRMIFQVYLDADNDEFMYDGDLNTLTPLIDGFGIVRDSWPDSHIPTTDPTGDGWILA